jgi:hypothetical protein
MTRISCKINNFCTSLKYFECQLTNIIQGILEALIQLIAIHFYFDFDQRSSQIKLMITKKAVNLSTYSLYIN